MPESTLKVDELLREAVRSKIGREREALRLFRPMEHQVPFLRSNARIRILRGGNRCLGGEQLIYDPVAGVERRIDEIDDNFHVMSRDPETGKLVVKRACAPFVKGYGSLYRVTLSNGETLVTTLEHRVLDTQGEWISIGDAWKKQVPLLCEPQCRASSSNGKSRTSTRRETAPVPQRYRWSREAVASGRQAEEAWNEASPLDVLECRDDSNASRHSLPYIQTEPPVVLCCASREVFPVRPLGGTQHSGRPSGHPVHPACRELRFCLPPSEQPVASLMGTVGVVRAGSREEQSSSGDVGHEWWHPANGACQEHNQSYSQARRQSAENSWFCIAQEDPPAIPASEIGRNREFSDDRPPSNLGTYLSVLQTGALRLSQTTPGCRGDYCLGRHPCDEPLPLEEVTDRAFSPLPDGVRGRSQLCWHQGDLESNAECSPTYHTSVRPSSLDGGIPITALCDEPESDTASAISGPSEKSNRTPQQSAELSSCNRDTSYEPDPQLAASGPSQSSAKEVGNTAISCHITEVDFVRQDFIFDITVEDFHVYFCSGILNRNSGKTATSFAATASCATGMPIWLSDTEILPYTYPINRPRKIWLVGKGVAHIGQTIYRMLFTDDNGLRIIRDERTKEWRSWNPNLEYDKAYKEKCRFADPLIPPRFLKGGDKAFGWEDKRLNFFKQVELIDGTMIYAFTSGGDAKQGDAVDLIHIDEDIEYPEHTMEWFMRLADYKGRMFWSVYPHSDNNALRDFHQMAEEERGKPEPVAEEFLLRFDQNEFIDKETRDQQLQVLLYAGEATYRARNLGEFTFDTTLVYNSFSPKIHTALINDESKRDAVDKVLRDRGGEPPDDWTRYFILDPGHAICAGLFLAVPPPEFGNYIVAYDEVYQRQSDAFKMAEAVSLRMAGHVFQDFIIDWHGGRQTPMGMSKTVKMIYREAFNAYGLRSVVRGADFAWGSDNITAGVELVRGWLSIKDNGLPTLRLVLARTPHFQKEFGLYSMRVKSGDICDEPIAQHNHLCDCARYAAAANIKYVRPKRSVHQINPAYMAYMKDRKADKESRKRGGKDYINLGPGAL